MQRAPGCAGDPDRLTDHPLAAAARHGSESRAPEIVIVAVIAVFRAVSCVVVSSHLKYRGATIACLQRFCLAEDRK